MVVSGDGVRGNILIADDEDGVRESLAEVLAEEGYRVTQVSDGEQAVEALNAQEFDIVISDVRMPKVDGLEVLQRAREVSPQTMVLLMTAHASVDTAVQALRRGAQDYLLKPLLFEDALHKIQYLLRNRQTAWENQFLRSQAERRWDFDNMIGRSAAMGEVMNLVRRVAPTPSTVLITGESGVGKEVVARAIHHFSDRENAILLPVNCGAIPENLHREPSCSATCAASFTGADSRQGPVCSSARAFGHDVPRRDRRAAGRAATQAAARARARKRGRSANRRIEQPRSLRRLSASSPPPTASSVSRSRRSAFARISTTG